MAAGGIGGLGRQDRAKVVARIGNFGYLFGVGRVSFFGAKVSFFGAFLCVFWGFSGAIQKWNRGLRGFLEKAGDWRLEAGMKVKSQKSKVKGTS